MKIKKETTWPFDGGNHVAGRKASRYFAYQRDLTGNDEIRNSKQEQYVAKIDTS